MNAKQFLTKLLAIRKRLNADGYSRRDVQQTMHAMKKVSDWMMFWNPTDEQVRNYIRKHRQLVEWIMPGEGSASRDKLMRELEELCA